MADDTIMAERRVKEMNRLSQEYINKTNQQFMNSRMQTRFEPVGRPPQGAQQNSHINTNSPPPSGNNGNNSYNGNNNRNNQRSNYNNNYNNMNGNPLAALFGGMNNNPNRNNINNNNYSHSSSQHKNPPPPAAPPPKPPPQDNINHEHKNQTDISGLFDGILGDKKIDEEKIILVILIILLARQGADLKLLIALGYLLV
jgi:hypothetical protein